MIVCIVFFFLAFFTCGITAIERKIDSGYDLVYKFWYGFIALGCLTSAIVQIILLVGGKI